MHLSRSCYATIRCAALLTLCLACAPRYAHGAKVLINPDGKNADQLGKESVSGKKIKSKTPDIVLNYEFGPATFSARFMGTTAFTGTYTNVKKLLLVPSTAELEAFLVSRIEAGGGAVVESLTLTKPPKVSAKIKAGKRGAADALKVSVSAKFRVVATVEGERREIKGTYKHKGTGPLSANAAPEAAGVFVTGLSINGGGAEAEVFQGDEVTLKVAFAASNSESCPGCIQQLIVGLDQFPLSCVFDAAPPVGVPAPGETTFQTPVPRKPGDYPLFALNTLRQSCTEALAAYQRPQAEPIGTIRVLTPRSKDGGKSVRLIFVNATPEPLQVFFVDFDGVEHETGSIEPDAEFPIASSAGHFWRLKSNGVVVHTYIATAESTQRVVFGEVDAENRRPEAVATGPGKLLVPALGVVLDGSGSSDPDEDPLTYSWEITGSPPESAAELLDATSSMATFVPDLGGRYVITLRVSDGKLEASADVTLNVNRPPLQVRIQSTAQRLQPGGSVTLFGTARDQEQGTNLAIQWVIVSKPSGSASTIQDPTDTSVVVPFDLAGDYRIRLTATDPLGASRFAEVSFTVIDFSVPRVRNAPPVPVIRGVPPFVEVGSTVVLDGSASQDPEDDDLRFQWSFLSGPVNTVNALQPANSDTATASFVVDATGVYEFELLVDDGHVAVSELVTFEALLQLGAAGNSVPVARFDVPAVVTLGKTITLDGTASSDPDGDPVTLYWEVLSGELRENFERLVGPTTSIIADTLGSYVVALNAMDPSGKRSVLTREITVVPEGLSFRNLRLDDDRLFLEIGAGTPLTADVEFSVTPGISRQSLILGLGPDSGIEEAVCVFDSGDSRDQNGAPLAIGAPRVLTRTVTLRAPQTAGKSSFFAATGSGSCDSALASFPSSPGAPLDHGVLVNFTPAFNPPVAVARAFVDGLLAGSGTVRIFAGQTLELDGSLSTNPGGGGLLHLWEGPILSTLRREEKVSVVIPEEFVGISMTFTLHVQDRATFEFDPVLSTASVTIDIVERPVKLSVTRVFVPGDNGPSVKNAFESGSVIEALQLALNSPKDALEASFSITGMFLGIEGTASLAIGIERAEWDRYEISFEVGVAGGAGVEIDPNLGASVYAGASGKVVFAFRSLHDIERAIYQMATSLVFSGDTLEALNEAINALDEAIIDIRESAESLANQIGVGVLDATGAIVCIFDQDACDQLAAARRDLASMEAERAQAEELRESQKMTKDYFGGLAGGSDNYLQGTSFEATLAVGAEIDVGFPGAKQSGVGAGLSAEVILGVTSRLNLDENEDPDSIEIVVTGTATLALEVSGGISGIEGIGEVGFELVSSFNSKDGKYEFEYDTTTMKLFVDVSALVTTGTIAKVGAGAGVRAELEIDFAQFEENKESFDKLFTDQDLSGVVAAIGGTEVTVRLSDRRIVKAGVEFESSFLGTGFGFEAEASWTDVGAVREEETTLREALVLILDPSALKSMGNTIVSAIDLN